MTDTPRRIGWIGTGRMGFQLCRRLLDAGHEVAVYNRTRSKAEPLQEHGAVLVDRPIDLAGCDIVFSMVSASDDLHAVMTGDGGLLTDSPARRASSSTPPRSRQRRPRSFGAGPRPLEPSCSPPR